MDSKTISWVSYLTFIGWIIAFIVYSNNQQKSSLATFHLRQSFGMMVSFFVLWLIYAMTFLSFFFFNFVLWFLYIALVVLWVLGLIAAINGEEKPVPVLGPLYQQWFAFIK